MDSRWLRQQQRQKQPEPKPKPEPEAQPPAGPEAELELKAPKSPTSQITPTRLTLTAAGCLESIKSLTDQGGEHGTQ